jgi:hypothetical protein
VAEQEYRVTIVFDYTASENLDEDELHDGIRESFDTIDLEFDMEVATFDENDVEVPDVTMTVTVNCDTVRDINVERMPT